MGTKSTVTFNLALKLWLRIGMIWLSISLFQNLELKGLNGFTFQVNNAVLDFSDIRNDISTPGAYLDKYYYESPELFRGVYISSLKVILPKAFKKRNQNKRIAVGATNLIIDSNGITGLFFS